MPARVITNSQGKILVNDQAGAAKAEIKAPTNIEKKEPVNSAKTESTPRFKEMYVHDERAKFYTGQDRLNLQNHHVKRVRELQEENDNLQREIHAKEQQVVDCKDPLAILAEIEHCKTKVARNTGEIVTIYSKNEERLDRIKDLQSQNSKMNAEMLNAQGRFASTNDMQLRTRLASEFFTLKETIRRNQNEIEDLSKN